MINLTEVLEVQIILGANATRIIFLPVERVVNLKPLRPDLRVPPRAFVLSPEDVGEAIPSVSSIDPPGLAGALAATPVWKDPAQAVIVVRDGPAPRLAVLGFFSAPEETRLQRLLSGIEMGGRNLRYVGYAQAERDCMELARKHRARFTEEDIARARFVAIPRGGLIVLGILSYFLNLKAVQFYEGREQKKDLLVIVDDCSLSGARFRETLQQYPTASRVVFAHLYSHPELRNTIERDEARVEACVSAHDLEDHAPTLYGEEYEAWLARWKRRSGNRPYWIGLPDRVGFAWNEPDINVWNETSHQSEHGWRVVPPELCLKNRIALKDGPRVFVQPDGGGPLRPAPEVVYGPLEDRILVARVDGEQCFDLQGTAADMWMAVVEHGSLDGVLDTLLAAYDIEEDRLRNDATRFIEQLLENGLLIDSRKAR